MAENSMYSLGSIIPMNDRKLSAQLSDHLVKLYYSIGCSMATSPFVVANDTAASNAVKYDVVVAEKSYNHPIILIVVFRKALVLVYVIPFIYHHFLYFILFFIFCYRRRRRRRRQDCAVDVDLRITSMLHVYLDEQIQIICLLNAAQHIYLHNCEELYAK